MDTVEVQEIWEGKKNENGTFVCKNLVAFLVNGFPMKVSEGYAVERYMMNKEEAELKYFFVPQSKAAPSGE